MTKLSSIETLLKRWDTSKTAKQQKKWRLLRERYEGGGGGTGAFYPGPTLLGAPIYSIYANQNTLIEQSLSCNNQS